jgi:hypothetical protein
VKNKPGVRTPLGSVSYSGVPIDTQALYIHHLITVTAHSGWRNVLPRVIKKFDWGFVSKLSATTKYKTLLLGLIVVMVEQ